MSASDVDDHTPVQQILVDAGSTYSPSFHGVHMLQMELAMTDLLEASARGLYDEVSDLLQNKFSENEDALKAELSAVDDWAGSSALHWATYANSAGCIALLLDAKANPDAKNFIDGSTPLHLAGRYGAHGAAERLISSGASVHGVNNRGNQPLHEAADHSLALVTLTPGATLRVAEHLLRARAQVDAYQGAPARQAITGADSAAERLFLTPLMLAAEGGSVGLLKLLLEWGADPLKKAAAQDLTENSCVSTEASASPSPLSRFRTAIKALSHMCQSEARRLELAGRRQKAVRVLSLGRTYELIALGLLEGVQAASDESKMANSAWSRRRKKINPTLVRDLWLQESTPFAAASESHIFVASSLVHSHVVELFYPPMPLTAPTSQGNSAAAGAVTSRRDDNWAYNAIRLFALVLHNIAWLPLLSVLPESVVMPRMREQRSALLAGTSTLWVAWLVPSGRAFLRAASALSLAVVLTVRVASVAGMSALDWLLLVWAVAMCEATLTEVLQQGFLVWRREFFNNVELLMIGLLVATMGCTFYDVFGGSGGDGSNDDAPMQLTHTLQAFGALTAWLRLMRACYFFPHAGPVLLTVLYLLADLGRFLVLMLFVLLAFGCAFAVCLHGAPSRQSDAHGSLLQFLMVMQQLVGVTLNGEPQRLQDLALDLALDPEDPPPSIAMSVSTFLLMSVFGSVAVVLLLSMLVARFTRSVNRVEEMVDKMYKLKFAQQTFQSMMRLRSSMLAPQPLNIVRRCMLGLYSLARPMTAQSCALTKKKIVPERRVLPGADQAPFGVYENAVWEEGSVKEQGETVDLFLRCALSDVKLFPEHVVEYVAASNHQLMEERQLVAQVGLAVGELRRVQEREALAMRMVQERHEEELKKLGEHLQILEQHLIKDEPGSPKRRSLGVAR